MFRGVIFKVLSIFILTLFSLWIDLPPSLPVKINLLNFHFEKEFKKPTSVFGWQGLSSIVNRDLVFGLDLAGGSHLVFEADTLKITEEKRKTAIEGARNVIERRVNLFGVSEPNVQVSNFGNKSRIIVELPGVKDTKKAIEIIGKTAQLVFSEAPENTSEGFKDTDLTGADLTSAKLSYDTNNGKPVVSIEFSEEGAKKFASLTKKNIGKPLAILLDGEVITAPVVEEEITGGSAIIKGEFTTDYAKELAIQLNAGALPIPVDLVQEKTVGATLGVESIEKSIKAGLVGLVMVLIFMIVSYGWLGLVANLGLLVFGILTFSLYKLIPVTLTLPGIAGFLLSVGMSVDSNILIFERFKEEKVKRPISAALEVSFGRAWDSIRDANIATLVTAFVLANPFDFAFLNTSGPIRGFAITLALGIGISLFSGIYVSRNLLRLFVRERKKL